MLWGRSRGFESACASCWDLHRTAIPLRSIAAGELGRYSLTLHNPQF
jgi:hypothetical protein